MLNALFLITLVSLRRFEYNFAATKMLNFDYIWIAAAVIRHGWTGSFRQNQIYIEN